MKIWSLLLALASTTSAFCPRSSSAILKSSVAAAAATSSPFSHRQPLRMIGSILDLLAGGEPSMVSPDKALPGRKQKMPNITGLRHYVLGNDLETVPEGHAVAVFANGCFW